ncbi:MAG: hypothetical protein NUV69_03195 [Candidatus Curtissbacteria bacterium]|nr:hypothetical protein [Candidatus Curtissbacteria bacterium]
MLSKSIIKLIDEAIVPAAALIVGKMIGFFIATYALGLSFTVAGGTVLGVLPSISFGSLKDYIIAENYSNITMLTVVVVGNLYVLVRAHFFHESHIKPSFHAKLASMNMEGFVAPTYHLYHQAVIWLAFLWLTTGFLLVSTVILKVTHPMISIAALLIAANFTWILSVDIENEIEISKQA